MRQSTIIVASVAAASLIVVGAYRVGRTHAPRSVDAVPAGEAKAGESADGNEALTKALGQLDRRLAALEVKQIYANAAGAQQASAPSAASAAPPDFEALKEKQEQRSAAVEAAVKSQPRDGAWAAATETELRNAADAVAKEGAHFAVRSVKCFSSVCEMVLSASSSDQLSHGNALAVLRHLGEVGSFDFAQPQTAPDGSATVTYRLFRKGYARPDDGA